MALNLGPLAIPTPLLLIVMALLVAAGAARLLGRSREAGIGNTLTDMLIVALLAARISFVAIWFDVYRSAPWSMLDIRDGGFKPWVGLAAALLLAGWRGWRHPALRKPLAIGLLAGALAWGAAFGAMRMMDNAGLPTVPLTTLAGEPVSLAALAAGKPTVINLWATWCPPCRREMPVLAAAQKQETGVTFAFINQGENGATVQHYLTAAELDLANVLLDRGAGSGRELGSTAMPTTFFYDANGRLVDTHLGGLSAATLASKLKALSTIRADRRN